MRRVNIWNSAMARPGYLAVGRNMGIRAINRLKNSETSNTEVIQSFGGPPADVPDDSKSFCTGKCLRVIPWGKK